MKTAYDVLFGKQAGEVALYAVEQCGCAAAGDNHGSESAKVALTLDILDRLMLLQAFNGVEKQCFLFGTEGNVIL